MVSGYFQTTEHIQFLNFHSYLPAATKLGQGNVFTGVCDSVHRGGLPQCMLGYHPPSPGSRPPRTRHTTPLSPGPDPPTRHPPGPDPPRPDTPPPPKQTLADSGIIRSTSGRYASNWNAFFLKLKF